jgi:glycerate kinase
LGENGAVRVFGPQKGVKEDELEEMELITSDFVELLARKSKGLCKDQEGFGAAGGIALGLNQFFPCQLEFGAPYFFEKVGIAEKVAGVDWVITGEGRYDRQSEGGKASFELLQIARNQGKKIALIASGKEGHYAGFDTVLELPELDFSQADFKKKAQEQIQGLFKEALRKEIFT